MNPKTYNAALAYAPFALWALVALAAIAGGLFSSPPGELSLALVVQLVAVTGIFLLFYRVVPALRNGIDTQDPVLLTALQSWRILGMLFLFLMMLGQLPAVFAIPAGVGDALVGLTAPFVADRLRRGKLSRRAFNWFTALGLLDFAVAFAAGNYVNLHPETYAGFASMTAWPLVIVPAFFVPAFALLHLAAWLSAQRYFRRASTRTAAEAATVPFLT